MFSFFKRNKSRPNPINNNTNSNKNENSNKLSLNMQLAIERQQASLHQTLELKRNNDVNDREQKDVNSHTVNAANGDDRVINRSTTLPSVSERDKSSVLPPGTCASLKQQNYDQYRDAKRNAYFQNDSIEHSSRQGNTPINYYQSNEKLSPTVVASSIKDQKCLTIAGTSSSNAYNSVYEVMGRGRNRNKSRGGGPNNPQNHNKSVVKNPQTSDDERVSKNVNDTSEVKSENSNVNLKNFESEPSPEQRNLNNSASAVENSEKSASISSENVFRDENSCSINSQPANKNDNIATSDEGKTAASEAASIVSADEKKNENLEESSVARGVKNDEHLQQQVVGAPLQRNPSAKRVSFAPSPPRSLASSVSDDEEETLSDDIFYEATEAQSDTQKLRILSTCTSHSSNFSRIDEETSEVDASTSNGESSSSSFSNNDVVCAKIILSVNESEQTHFSDNDDKTDNNIKNNAFSSEETSISSDVESAPKTVKPSYLLVGEDTIALPDIVAETSLFEQHQQQQHHQHQHQVDEM